ncbi:hypothetical protein LTR70_004944 [Exophiala xenobiotica]|uniref:Uncharacterized protein n=1 Tax=Lithohypha guttulata TaxID=1690604 RepID=A0ABR0KDF8_9EURO|nr:hypothetical protein LTR24_004524 [Lithohypha guttulata]KAK5319760.1 hypothetical protein LTR70_004944 [Exophiala xenobiotica]
MPADNYIIRYKTQESNSMSGYNKNQNEAGRGEDSESEDSEPDVPVNAPLQAYLGLPGFNPPLRHPPMRPTAQENQGLFFPQPPPGYSFQNTSSSDPEKARKTRELVEKMNKTKTRPNTKKYYENNGSIEQPQDGKNVKRDKKDKCLTCISQGAACHGTEITGGSCRICKGRVDKTKPASNDKEDTKPSLKPKAQRTCRWKQPDKNIWTYKDHQQRYDPDRTIYKNTKLGRLQREMRKQKLWPNVWDLAPQSHEGQILRWIAAGMVNSGGLSNDPRANLDAMMEVTMRRMSYVARASNIPDQRIRQEVVAAVNEIYLRLLLAREDGTSFTEQQIRALLPENHPRKHG